MGFQTRVNRQPAPAAAGDFAGSNPRMSVSAPSGGYTVAPDYPASVGGALVPSLLVGRFAWFNYATGLAANYFQPASLLGFVHKENQTIITRFLDQDRLAVQAGFPVTGQSRGDFWADFVASAPDAAGLVVYADPVTGAASANVAGQGVKFAITASLANTGVLTVTVTAGVLAAGQIVTGVGVPPGTFITAQLTGAAGSTGTYQLNQGVTLTSRAMTAYGLQETPWKLATPVAGTVSFTGAIDGTPPNNVLAASVISGGALGAGQFIAGANIPPNTVILAQLTGPVGGAGNYELNNFFTADIGAEAMTATQGTLGKISTWQA